MYLRTTSMNNRMLIPITLHACHNRLLRQGGFNFTLTICSVMHRECSFQASFVVDVAQCIQYRCLDFRFSHRFFSALAKQGCTYVSLFVCELSWEYRSVFCPQRLHVVHMVPDNQPKLAERHSVPFIEHSLICAAPL